jgi:hypothetical protein
MIHPFIDIWGTSVLTESNGIDTVNESTVQRPTAIAIATLSPL